MSPFDAEDEYKLIPLGEDRIVVDRKDLSIRGAWINGHFVEGKDLSEEYKMRAHSVIRKETFDIIKEV